MIRKIEELELVPGLVEILEIEVLEKFESQVIEELKLAETQEVDHREFD